MEDTWGLSVNLPADPTPLFGAFWSTFEQTHSSFIPLTTDAVAATTQLRPTIGRSAAQWYCSNKEGLVSIVCVCGVCVGGALFRPLGSQPPPVFSFLLLLFMHRGRGRCHPPPPPPDGRVRVEQLDVTCRTKNNRPCTSCCVIFTLSAPYVASPRMPRQTVDTLLLSAESRTCRFQRSY